MCFKMTPIVSWTEKEGFIRFCNVLQNSAWSRGRKKGGSSGFATCFNMVLIISWTGKGYIWFFHLLQNGANSLMDRNRSSNFAMCFKIAPSLVNGKRGPPFFIQICNMLQYGTYNLMDWKGVHLVLSLASIWRR